MIKFNRNLLKSGFVSIIGNPNTGKSTLFNLLIEENLSGVTYKPQTTRNKIKGILTKGDAQVIFLDTPGHLKPAYKLQEFMEKEIEDSLVDTDIILYVIDAEKYSKDKEFETYSYFSKFINGKKLFIIINKIDTRKKEQVLVMIDEISRIMRFSEIVPLSAKNGFNVDILKELIMKNIPDHAFYYDSQELTDKSERFFITDIIRNHVLRLFREEIPYSVFIEINEFKERDNGIVYINSNIILDRKSHKKIIIGDDGRMIKQIGQKARKEIEEFLNKKVYLELFVKVVKDWKNNEEFLRNRFNS